MSPASHLVQVPARPVTCPGGQGRRLLADWLARADVQLDGPRPHDPQIRRERAIGRIVRGGTRAGRAYVDGARPHLAVGDDRRFRRLWRYYLLTCAGAFRSRANQLWQLVMSPSGVTGGYRRPEL